MATENSENFLSNAFNSIGEYVNSVLDAASDSQQVAGYSVAEIGKPFKFATTVDPLDRGYRFLATRMNVIDLYPCNYALNYLYNNSSKKSMFKYGIGYDKAMEKYRKMCTDYLGLLNPPSALRIFLTDDTTTTDGIATEYTDNFFQKKADDLSNRLQNFTALGTSLSSAGMHSAVDKVLADFINTDKIVGYVSGGLGLSQKASDSLGTVIEGLKQGAAIVLKGNKLSLPKIWQNSSYRPTFSISTKLFSPYGSPKAVQEYIVKPLTMILLMSTPQSDDMISYNRPFAVTVRSWGTSFLTLAGITSVTLQRGGSDSVYNIYKQPLVINVNMEFTSLVDGAIAFSSNDEENKIPEYEKTSYAMTGNILSLNSDSQNIDGSVLPTVVPTVGGIIRSLQPVQFSGLTYGFGPQQSTRDNVMVGGNGNVGPLPFGQNLGILSAFGGIYDYAKNSALNQFEFGTYLLGGVTDTMNGITNSAISITAGVNNVLNATTNLANTISLGAFSNTQFANQIRKTQNTMNGAVLAGAAVTSATNQLENSLNYASRTFGSLLSVPVGN